MEDDEVMVSASEVIGCVVALDAHDRREAGMRVSWESEFDAFCRAKRIVDTILANRVNED